MTIRSGGGTFGKCMPIPACIHVADLAIHHYPLHSFVEDAELSSGSLHIQASSNSFSNEPNKPFTVTIRYLRPCEAFRGLGHVLGVLRSPLISTNSNSTTEEREDDILSISKRDEQVMMDRLPIKETANFETLGTMIDCSRNGVLLVKTVKFLLKKLSLMGYNMLQLYTEDTYKIEGEPFFGYLRGGYSEKALKEIDDYAFDLGIEVIPCIQTLGHLGQMLQWPRFLHLRDTSEVLLADAQETYVMVRKMIQAATKPFRTKKIHLGMDETHGLGHGRYHSIFGQYNYKDPTRIFIDHLSRVNAICVEMGLQPCIWSDMLFCLNAKNNSLLGYYDSQQPTASVEGIPSNIELVYWDYYHTSQQSYTSRIQSHRLLSRKNPWMAGGSWTWSRFWTALPFTFATNKASMNACKQRNSGVKHVFLTIWGDEGNEVDILSSLPAWSYYAEHGYEKEQEVDLIRLRASFDGICAGVFDDYVMASRLDDPSPEKQTVDDGIHFAPNTSKWLMWEEPAYGFVSPSMQASGLDLEHHYTSLATYLEGRLRATVQQKAIRVHSSSLQSSIGDYPLNARLRFAYLIAKTLSYKSGLRYHMHLAYINMNWSELYQLAGPEPESRLSKLREYLRQLISYHRQMWMATYEPFGWEVLELRYGGQASRLETFHLRISRFLNHIEKGGQVGMPLKSNAEDEMNDDEFGRRDEDEEIMLNVAAGTDLGGYEEEVTSVAELAQPLQVVYSSADQLLDYHRVSRQTYC